MPLDRLRYARAGDLHIAYQVLSDGPFDLVVVPPAFSTIESWTSGLYRDFVERLTSFCRLVVLDKRGMGRSDGIDHHPTMEERIEDVHAVLDAIGSSRAAVLGASEGGPIAAALAATYPQRVSALVLVGALARFAATEDFPWGKSPEEIRDQRTYADEHWGTGSSLAYFAPSLAGDEWAQREAARAELNGGSPKAILRMLDTAVEFDARPVFPTVRVPTLVVHRTGDQVVHVEQGRYIAAQIPGARYVELPGSDHVLAGTAALDIADEIQEFLTGVRSGPVPDRVLATVLFTDIVASTELASELGDATWTRLLERHDEMVREQLRRCDGLEVKTTGDGFLARFDGPARAIRCAVEICRAASVLGLAVRAGLHTGECEVVGDDLHGIAVHIGSRVVALAGPEEVLVSRTVKDLVAGSGIDFDARGSHLLKGVPGEWSLYAVRTRAP